MKKDFDYDDEILGLVRQEGLLKPSGGFTSRVMMNLEKKSELVTVYQPLLSKRAWIILAAAFVILSIICWQFFLQTPGEPAFYANALNKATEYVNSINYSFEVNTNALLIITLAIFSMGILLFIDLWFSNNRRETA